MPCPCKKRGSVRRERLPLPPPPLPLPLPLPQETPPLPSPLLPDPLPSSRKKLPLPLLPASLLQKKREQILRSKVVLPLRQAAAASSSRLRLIPGIRLNEQNRRNLTSRVRRA